MVIQGSDYRLTPIDDNDLKFDLELLYHVKGKSERDEFKNVAYGLSLDTAIKRIVQYRITQNYKDNAIELSNYFKDFKSYLEQLKNEIL